MPKCNTRGMYGPKKSDRWWVWIDNDEEFSLEDLNAPICTIPADGTEGFNAMSVAGWAADILEEELVNEIEYGSCALFIQDRSDLSWYRVELVSGGWSAREQETIDISEYLPPLPGAPVTDV